MSPFLAKSDFAFALAMLLFSLAPAGANCDADVNGDGLVDGLDVMAVQIAWGTTCLGCTADIDNDQEVTILDYLLAGNAAGVECPVLQETDLAGRSLATFPFFDYVLAFNQGSPIEVAVDTYQHPRLGGQTVDLYIVEAKTFEAWQADGSLTDVTIDGHQTVALVADSLTANIIQVSGSEGLSSDAGIGIGHPYDVVIDVNQNGVFDRGDLIDGYGDPEVSADRRDGFYVVHDLTQAGPLAVTQVAYTATEGSVTTGFRPQEIFYPTDIASLGERPLVVVSHGNGHNYQWYDHVGQHLASYGFVVMSHANNTVPGVFSASTTTLEHTDAFLEQIDLIEGGVLSGHIDSHKIVWLGHSRGGEGVAIAADRILKGDWVPRQYALSDIVLISSIAPVDFLGPSRTNPHSKNFHLWTGGADSDVSGCADSDTGQTFHLHDRASDYRQSISLYGAGHGAFHNGDGSLFATGPCLLTRAETHLIMKGYLLPLVKHYVEDNIPSRDFLWRQWESFKPLGAPDTSCAVVNLMYREGQTALFKALDDYQNNSSPNVSSVGEMISFDVTDLAEARFDDGNSSLTHDPSDAMNGVTLGSAEDDTAGVIFSFDADRYYQVDVPPDLRNFTEWRYLQFRAAQGTRHPLTISALEDLVFDVVLMDGAGNRSPINIGAYGGGIEEPYQRNGCGNGVGWANDFETVRLRIADFAADNRTIDLNDIRSVRFEFGPSHGAPQGRVAFDELMLSKDGPTLTADRRLKIQLESDVGEFIPPGMAKEIVVLIKPGEETLLPGTAMLHYTLNGGNQVDQALVSLGSDRYAGTLPNLACGDEVAYYFSATGSLSGLGTLPLAAPTQGFTPAVGSRNNFFEEPMDVDPGWTAEGSWAFGQNSGGGGSRGSPDPTMAATGTTLYGYELLGDYGNNLQETHLTTPAIDCTGKQKIELRFQRFLGVEQPLYDHAYVRVSTDGTNFTTIWENTSEVADSSWQEVVFDISAIADNQATVYLRWTMGGTDGSVVYCGWNLDDVSLSAFSCP